ncbi:MAG: hypothetical protein R3B47_07170 [Bacteroidia bacterium]
MNIFENWPEKVALLCSGLVLWLCVEGCNESGGPLAARPLREIVPVLNESDQQRIDSVDYVVLDGLAFTDEGKIIESSIEASVQKRIQDMPSGACFFEIYSNAAPPNWFLFNLEAVRREFIRQGLDPVLISTHKKTRSFLPGPDVAIAFTVVLAGS